jgi:hypothetical protein
MAETMSSDARLRVTVAHLMHVCEERQTHLATRIGITQGALSRKLDGRAGWSFRDLDRLSAHYGIPVQDLLGTPEHAEQCLPRRREQQLLIAV